MWLPFRPWLSDEGIQTKQLKPANNLGGALLSLTPRKLRQSFTMVCDHYCHTGKTCEPLSMNKSIQRAGRVDCLIPVLEVRTLVVKLSKVICRLLRRGTVKHAKETASRRTGRSGIGIYFSSVWSNKFFGGARDIFGASFLPVIFSDSRCCRWSYSNTLFATGTPSPLVFFAFFKSSSCVKSNLWL